MKKEITALTVWTTGQVLVLCTAFLCLSDRLTVTLSLCLLLKLNDDDDDDDDDDTAVFTL